MVIQIISLAIMAVLIIYILYKYGVFNKFQMHEDVLDDCQVLYISYKGSYQAIGKQFEQLNKKNNQLFSISNKFGFYYDNPANTKPENCRAVIGILVNRGQQFKIKKFKQQNPEFRQRHLKRTKCLAYYMPFINRLSFIVMVSKVYPSIHAYLKKQEIDYEKGSQGMMQLYRFQRAHRQIDIILCLENKQQFNMYYDSQIKEENKKMSLQREQ